MCKNALHHTPFYIATLCAVLALFLCAPPHAHAYQIVQTGTELRGDFALEPAKIELTMAPGSSQVVTLHITNRDRAPRTFTVSTEDTSGSDDPSTPIILLGSKQGPYTLRDNLLPETRTFTLPSRAQILLPVTVTIPAQAEPGGKYATVIISSSSGQSNAAGSQTVARLAALFFVRIPGTVDEGGSLQDFSSPAPHGILFNEAPIAFELLYRNTGSVHLDPTGHISITNIYGMNVGDVIVDPFYAMPKSLRFREVTWSHSPLIGRYTATLSLTRGYASTTDERTIAFWVLPWKAIAGLFLVFVIVVFLVRGITRRFEFRRRT